MQKARQETIQEATQETIRESLYLVNSYTFAELFKQNPDTNVMHQFQKHQSQLIMAVSVWQELQFSIELMPESKRKNALYTGFIEHFGKLPLVDYDKKCAETHAKICAIYQREGRSLTVEASQNASIAIAHDFTLVTHDPTRLDLVENLIIENWFEYFNNEK